MFPVVIETLSAVARALPMKAIICGIVDALLG